MVIWYCEQQKTLVAHNYPTDKEAVPTVHKCDTCGITRYKGTSIPK